MVEQEIRIKQIIENLSDAIVVSDSMGNIKYLNPASVALLGYTLKEAIGQPLSDIVTLVNEHSDEPIPNIALNAIHSGQDENCGSNSLLIGRDGVSELPVEIVARPLYTPNGTINGALLTIHDVRIARFSRKQLSWTASHDALTGVYNKPELERQCHALMLTAKRDNNNHAIVRINIDHFRQLNEMSDHSIGDNLLIQVSQLLRSLLRANDSVFREIADIFLILLPHCQIETAQKIADNIRQQIGNIRINLDTGQKSVTASIGISAICKTGANSVANLLNEVENAGLISKQNGRNQVNIFNSVENREYNQELLLLQETINNGNFRLYYQLIKATNNTLPVCEVLLRRVDSTGVEHEPSTFLPLCERSGLIVEIDAWVVRNILELIAFNTQFTQQFSRIHINLSAYSFASYSFLEEVQSLISNYHLPEGFICFEVSEASIMKNLIHAQQFMGALSMLGCRFALDDVDANLTMFDTFSSLPIDMIKIDGKLIKSITSTKNSSTLVRTINEMAKNINIKTVAQQVEDNDIYEWLCSVNLDYVQGFIVHKPLPIETLIY